MKYNICVVTGSRADFGLLKNLLISLSNEPRFNLQLCVCGNHFNKKYGSTIKEIKKSKIRINYKINLAHFQDTPDGICRLIGKGIKKFSHYLKQKKPSILVILGDRYEVFAAATAALILRVPILHLYGGEVTEGAYDESIRHCISKMAQFHIVANKVYKKRLIQMGERPSLVFIAGGLGVDNLKKTKIIPKEKLQKILNFRFNKKNVLITFHPETLSSDYGFSKLDNLLNVLNKFKNLGLLFTYPNFDSSNSLIITKIKSFCKKHKNARALPSLGQEIYFSCIKYSDGVVGNSSSGLTEVPYFGKGTINIGDRQRGRLTCKSIINSNGGLLSIKRSLDKLLSESFQKKIKHQKIMYGKAGACEKIKKVLKKIVQKPTVKKTFYDLKIL